MDGVLVDWTGGVHQRLGVPYSYHQWPYRWGPDGWNWHDEIGHTFAEVSDLCDFDFWANLKWHHDGQAIMNIVQSMFDVRGITLLTTPMPNVMSASGKIAWIRRELPHLEKQLLICPGDKSILAQVPDSILIDDSTNNVVKWRSLGGKAILVPRPWNIQHGWFMLAAESIATQLERMSCRET